MRGVIIGLSLGAPIGPINVEIVRRGLRSGFLPGWLVGAGAITADAIYCLLTIIGLAPLVDNVVARVILLGAGGAFLVYLGVMSLRAARDIQAPIASQAKPTDRRSYVTGFTMALLNPYGIVFWLSLGGALAASGVDRAGFSGTAAITLGVIAGLLAWITILSTLVHGGRRFVSDRLFQVVNLVSGLVLAGFGFWFLAQVVGELA